MDWISKYVAVWQGRIAFRLAFFGAILVGLWPDRDRNIDPAKLVACILTGLAWLVAELASAGPRVSEHDRNLFARILGIMNDNTPTFLMQHDFAINFNAAHTKPISELAEGMALKISSTTRRFKSAGISSGARYCICQTFMAPILSTRTRCTF